MTYSAPQIDRVWSINDTVLSGVVLSGGPRGEAHPSSQRSGSHCPPIPPNKIFGKCNWTPGMKI